MTADSMPLDTAVRLDVWADIACPWCYIGSRRLATVLASEEAAGRPVRVRHRSFQLQPDLPPEGVAMRPFFESTFGGADQMERMFTQVSDVGREVGIAFDFEAMPKAPNTRLAHELVLSYGDDSRQGAVLEGLFSAYFQQGLDVTDREVLARVIEGVTGESAFDVAARLALTSRVDAEFLEGHELGVSAVPMFVADAGEPDGEFGLSPAAVAVQGAQPERTLRRLIDEARARARG